MQRHMVQHSILRRSVQCSYIVFGRFLQRIVMKEMLLLVAEYQVTGACHSMKLKLSRKSLLAVMHDPSGLQGTVFRPIGKWASHNG
jgi:hypothetical protein